MPCQIEIGELELQLHIGCGDEERSRPQPVITRIAISNDGLFAASTTDRIQDTLNVEEIISALKDECADTRFNTLERLAAVLETRFREQFLSRGLTWELTLRKPRFGWSYAHTWTS